MIRILFISLLFFVICFYSNSQEKSHLDSIKVVITANNYLINPYIENGKFIQSNEELNTVEFKLNKKLEIFFADKILEEICIRKIKKENNKIIINKHNSINRKTDSKFKINLIENLKLEILKDKCCELELVLNNKMNSKNCCNLNNNDFEINTRWIKKNINRKEIISRAKEIDEDWKLNKEYSNKNKKFSIFKAYSNIDSLNLFLSEFNRPINIYKTHVSKSLELNIIRVNDTILSLSKNIDIDKSITPWTDNRLKRQIYNPKINQLISQMIPSKFLFKKIIKYDYLKEAYIDWILNKI